MSETLTTAADNVRFLTGDRDASNYVHDTVAIYQHLIDQAQRLGTRIGLGVTTVSSVFTLSVGSTADYTWAVTDECHKIIALFIPSLGRYLIKVSLDDINAMREGIVAGTATRGDPQYFAAYENNSNILAIRIDTVPSTARAVDILWHFGATTAYTDSTTLPFGDTFLRVLEKATAAELMAKALPEERARIGFNTEVLPLWASQVDEGVLLEVERMARIERAPYGVGAVGDW